jgi:aminopeptidase 2
VNQIFDAISYMKGSCVLRMISSSLGEEVFLEGVRRYLKRHAYGSTRTGDLWEALSSVSGKDVGAIMKVWTEEIGYPVITVTENETEGTIHVKQNRLLATGDAKPEEDQIIYPISLGLRTRYGVDTSLFLDKREDSFKIKDTDFFKLNADHIGIYRTSYTPERLGKLGKAVRDGLLTVEDRAGMIADAGALAIAGYQKTSSIFSMLKGFDSETEYAVWKEIQNRLKAIDAAWIFEDASVQAGLQAFRRDLFAKKAKELGWEFSATDEHVQKQLKAMLFSSAGLAGDETVVQAAKAMFKEFFEGHRDALNPNLRDHVFEICLKHGGKDEVRRKECSPSKENLLIVTT